MRSRASAVSLSLALLCQGAEAGGVPDVVEGSYGPDYDGGHGYYYDDPGIGALPPLFFDHSTNMTCGGKRKKSTDEPFRGVNLGGWLLMEPWITPSMFYQFLGTTERYGADAPAHTGLDMYTFCAALGPEEGNRQLRRHWKAWVTEEDFKRLAELGVNAVRIPVGDWMWRPYGPYVNCTDGALDELTRALDLAHAYGMRALIDMHGVRDSQNGFDNSGMMRDLQWTVVPGWFTSGQVSFSHWAEQSPAWIGDFDRKTWRTVSLKWYNVDWAIDTLCMIVEMYKGHPAVFGIQPLNEPWPETPIGPLKRFYWEAYKAVKRRAPKWKFVISDSFRPTLEIWAPFMTGCPDTIISTHLHQAWAPAQAAVNFMISACETKNMIEQMHEQVMDMIVGEWALATDNCAMWLNGFNDNLPGYPVVECDWVPCTGPYMGVEQPGAPPDQSKAEQGPFGTGMSTPRYGYCPVDRAWENDDEVTTALALKKLNAYSSGLGWFFWNFKTELEPKWSYQGAVEKGWIPRSIDGQIQLAIDNSCNLEERGAFRCVVKKGVPLGRLTEQVNLACKPPEMSKPFCSGDIQYRIEHASEIFTQFWRLFHNAGKLCDFDGSAELVADGESDVPYLRSELMRAGTPDPPPRSGEIAAPITISFAAFATAVSITILLHRPRKWRQDVHPTDELRMSLAREGRTMSRVAYP